MEIYAGFVMLFILAVGNAAVMIALTTWLGPRKTAAKGKMFDTPYECGVQPAEIKRGHLSVKFFVVALLFILFDIELVFLFPWAVIYRELGWFGFFEMVIFLAVVLAGLFYSVKKGALKWR